MWHTSVDVNTKFYHALRKKRRSVNRLVGLHDEGGQWITEEKGVEKIVVDYFDDWFRSNTPSEFESFLEEIPLSITLEMNQRLICNASEEEVRQALFMMHLEKGHEPDGMTTLFFCPSLKRTFWIWWIISWKQENWMQDWIQQIYAFYERQGEIYTDDWIEADKFLHRGLQDYIQGIMSKVQELQVFLYMTIIFHSFKGRFINFFFHLVTSCCLKLLPYFWNFSLFWSHLNASEYVGFSDMRQTWKSSPKSSRKSYGGVFSLVSSFITNLSVLVCLHLWFFFIW